MSELDLLDDPHGLIAEYCTQVVNEGMLPLFIPQGRNPLFRLNITVEEHQNIVALVGDISHGIIDETEPQRADTHNIRGPILLQLRGPVMIAQVLDHADLSGDGRAAVRHWRSDRAQGTAEMADLTVGMNEALGTLLDERTTRQIRRRGRYVSSRDAR